MPRLKLTKNAIDALPIPESDVVHWDTGLPGFGVKVTPKGRKVFIVLYRTGSGFEAAQIYRRALRSRDASSGSRGCTESVRSQGGRPGSGGREAGGEAASCGRSRGGSAGKLHRATTIPEPHRRRDRKAPSPRSRKGLERQ